MVAHELTPRRMGIRELRDHLNEVLREVRDERLAVDVTRHGQVVAELRPKRVETAPSEGTLARSAPPDDNHRRWSAEMRRLAVEPRSVDPVERRRINEERDRLAERLAKSWPTGLSAVDAIREDRDAE